MSDEERQKPNVILDSVFRACENFNENPEASRLIINAALESPVPLLPQEDINQIMDKLRQAICPDEIANQQAALLGRFAGFHEIRLEGYC